MKLQEMFRFIMDYLPQFNCAFIPNLVTGQRERHQRTVHPEALLTRYSEYKSHNHNTERERERLYKCTERERERGGGKLMIHVLVIGLLETTKTDTWCFRNVHINLHGLLILTSRISVYLQRLRSPTIRQPWKLTVSQNLCSL